LLPILEHRLENRIILVLSKIQPTYIIMKIKSLISCVAICFILTPFLSNCQTTKSFKKTILTRDFLSEGVAVADINKDGHKDIIAGYYWFEAPNWVRHELPNARPFDPRKEYSKSFLNYTLDVNLDGWVDIVNIDYPGTPAYWFENPKNKSEDWLKHIISDSVGIGNESPGFIDIDGDGRIDLLCADVKKKQIIWLQAPTEKGETEWKRHALSKENVDGTDRFSHGIGYGDINHDGTKDVVITSGWFEGKSNKSSGDWTFHPANLGEACSHMQVLDVNNDGRNDIVTASAHKLGVWWYEQITENNTINFKRHLMSETTSQTHASIMADLDGDGKEEYITGKRFLAHNGNDEGDADAPLLMWFEFTPNQAPYFKEHFIDDDSGAGLNIAIDDMNNDEKPDIIISNKNGVFLMENKM
jgi:hypothetical protein